MTVSVLIGVVHLAVAATLLTNVRRTAAMFPWMVALAAFFTVRGIDRIVHAVHVPPAFVSHIADAFAVVTLLLLLVGLGRTITGLREAYEDAERRQAEYARALRDYRQLARHRLANPLAAIRGGLITLRDLDPLPARERIALLDMLDEQAQRLERLSLDPHAASAEERALNGVPLLETEGRG